jgi:hypothetical protein
MRLVAFAAISAALVAASPASAQVANNPQHPQGNVHAPAMHPNYAMHPGARGFVQRPMWRRPMHVAGHPHFHFRYGGHAYVVLAGPIFVAPSYFPYVSTPYYPASFYGQDDPGSYFLYYCPSPAGYYPDVADCPAGWWQTAPEDGPESYQTY